MSTPEEEITHLREIVATLNNDRNVAIDRYLKLEQKLKVLSLDSYQAETRRTASTDDSTHVKVSVLALGLCGESGEVAEIIKKWVGHGITFELDKLKKELGDVLWYVTRLADEHGISLKDVAQSNIDKLRARYPEGFKRGGGVR